MDLFTTHHRHSRAPLRHSRKSGNPETIGKIKPATPFPRFFKVEEAMCRNSKGAGMSDALKGHIQ